MLYRPVEEMVKKEGNMSRDFLKDMVRYLPAQMAPAIVGFISMPVITRLFPPKIKNQR